MPKIPTYQRSVLPPGTAGGVPMSPGPASAVGRGLSNIGGGVFSAGMNFAKIQAYEQKASDAVAHVEDKYAIKNGSLGIVDRFNGRTDFENFDEEAETAIEEFRAQLLPDDASPARLRDFNELFEQQAFFIRSAIKAKKLTVMNERGKIAFGNLKQQTLEEIAATEDQKARDILKAELRIEGFNIQENFGVSALWIETELDGLDAEAKKFASDQAEIAIRNLRMDDPGRALDILNDKSLLTDLDPKVRQAEKERCKSALKVQEKEAKQAEKDAAAELHEQEDDEIYETIKKGEFLKALALVDKSSLNAHEKNAWERNIRERQNRIKSGDKEVDPTKITDPREYNRIADAVYNSPETIEPVDIYNLIGKGADGGLSQAHGDRFVKILKEKKKAIKDNATPKKFSQDKAFSNGVTALKEEWRFGTFGEGRDGVIKHQKALEDYEHWCKANPDKNPSEKLEEILAPAKEEHTKSMLDNLWNYFTPSVAVPALLKAEEMLRPDQPGEQAQTKRQQAIDILEKGGYVVNEETIKKVESQLK